MNFALAAGDLASLLETVKGAINPRATLPILQHVLVEASAGRVAVRGSCIDREMACSAPADVKVDGTAAIRADMLHGLAKRLPKSAVVTVAVEGDIATVSSGKASYKLKTLPPDTFPTAAVPEGLRLSLPAADVATLFGDTLPATRPDSSITYERGVHLHTVGEQPVKLVAVGLDGHRLAYRELEVSDDWRSLGGITLPADAVRQIISMTEGAEAAPVEFTLSDARTVVRCGTAELSAAVLDCEYPDYTRVMPKPNGAFATVKPADLIDAVERAIIVLDGEAAKTPAVGLAAGDVGISVTAGKRGHEVADETLAASIHERGADLDINAAYLTGMLNLWPEGAEVEIQQAEPGHPVLLWSRAHPAYRQVILPMRR
jgi:DNA polymerase-3 subunit beta